MTQQWKLVPVEPTPKMIKAWHDAYSKAIIKTGRSARAYAAMLAAAPASAQPERDWELSCDHCNGSGHVFVERQVAERKSDVQEFKEDCECCDGRGFNIAFEDIPGIAEYVRKSRPGASAQDDVKDERQAFEAWHKREFGDFMADAANHYNRWLGWQGHASIAAPAAGDARMARQLLPKLQSLLDRMASDPHTGTMFEADGDTLRDAMHLCRSVVVDAASQQQEG